MHDALVTVVLKKKTNRRKRKERERSAVNEEVEKRGGRFFFPLLFSLLHCFFSSSKASEERSALLSSCSSGRFFFYFFFLVRPFSLCASERERQLWRQLETQHTLSLCFKRGTWKEKKARKKKKEKTNPFHSRAPLDLFCFFLLLHSSFSSLTTRHAFVPPKRRSHGSSFRLGLDRGRGRRADRGE